MTCLISWMSGKETSAKNFISQGERLMKNITDDSSSYLLLKEIGLFIKTRQDLSVRRKVTRKKEDKICHFA